MVKVTTLSEGVLNLTINPGNTVQLTNGSKFNVGSFTFEILTNEMNAEMTEFAIDTIILAFTKSTINLDISDYITEKFNEKFKNYWQCVVSGNFAATVYNKEGHYIVLRVNDMKLMLFKARDD